MHHSLRLAIIFTSQILGCIQSLVETTDLRCFGSGPVSTTRHFCSAGRTECMENPSYTFLPCDLLRCPKATFLFFFSLCQKTMLYLSWNRMRWEVCGLEADTMYNFTASTVCCVFFVGGGFFFFLMYYCWMKQKGVCLWLAKAVCRLSWLSAQGRSSPSKKELWLLSAQRPYSAIPVVTLSSTQQGSSTQPFNSPCSAGSCNFS